MPAPERRERRDLLAATAIVVVVAVAAVVVWWRSDARATTSTVATAPLPALAAADTVPTSLRPLWTAASAATTAPVVVAGVAVTADAATVTGRDPLSGAVSWSYRRNLALCATAGQWGFAVAVYRDSGGCRQVTALQGASGARGPQRNSSADSAVTLVGDGTYLASLGSTRLELWRSDLVRTLEYGRVDTPVTPGAQPRTGCTLRSAGSVPTRLAVLESCPGETADRLTLLKPAPADATRPEQQGSVLTASADARLLAVTEQGQALLVTGPSGNPELARYDASGVLTGQYPLPLTPSDLAAPGALAMAASVAAGSVIAVSVGTSIIALNSADLTPRWTTTGVLGAGTVVAGNLLVPTPGAVTALDPATGAVGARIAVDRGGYDPAKDGPLSLAAAGPVILEQRGATLVALGS